MFLTGQHKREQNKGEKMGKWDVSEWVPSEEELRAELCNAREIDWPAEASKYINYLDEWSIGTSCDYGEYMRALLRDGRNFPEIPLRYMASPADWIDRPLEFILNQILNSPEEYRGYIMGMVNRYLTACFKRLDGKWPSDRWDGSGNPFFTRNCYTFCCPELVGDDDLLRKIIVLQKLQTMISDQVQQDTPAEQAEEPAAGDGAADRQLIGWCGTAEQLEKLANELQKGKFVASAEAFAGQFDKAARKADRPYKWEDDVTLLAYLFDLLKEVSLVKKKSTTNPVVESSFLVKNLRQARSNYQANNKTLSGELNNGKEGIPDKGKIIHQIVMRIKCKG